MGAVKFFETTLKKYNELLEGNSLDNDALYFLQDVGQIKKGVDNYTNLPTVSKDAGAIDSAVTNVNFTGKGFVVESDPENPGRVNVSMPFNLAKMTASNYNSTGGNTTPSVADINKNTTNGTANTYQERYVALPGDGTYSVDSTWNATAIRNVLNKNVTTIKYTTSDFFWLVDNASTKFRITLTKGDGTEVSEVAGPITGAGTFSTTNCSVVIDPANWSEDFMGYKAKATISVGVSGMLGGAGKFNVKITHLNGGSEYSKEQTGLFYDDNPAAGEIASGSIALNKKDVTKWLSGVEYYTTGCTVDVTLSNVNGVFNKSFISSVGTITTNCTGDISYTATNVAEAAGATLATAKNNTNASTLKKSSVALSANKYLSDIQFTKATCSNGWNTNTLETASTTTIDKPIDTYAAASTKINEAFQDENYRLKSDLATAWSSKDALTTTDLKCGEGTYLINTSSGTDQYYYRNFGGTQSSGVGIFTLTGDGISEKNFITNNYFDIQISLNGSTWYSVKYLSTESTGIDGVSGIRAQKSTYNLDNTSKCIYYALPAGITTDTNTGKAGSITSYGIFVKIRVSNSTVKLNNISIEFK